MDKLEALSNYLENDRSKAFILLQNGRIVYENYYDGHTADLPHYWASAGKTLTAFLYGLAIDEGRISLDSPISDVLGDGWTSCDPADEYERTLVDHLTFTSGFNEYILWDCYTPACLRCLAEPGERWSYHQGQYTLLLSVLENIYGIDNVDQLVEDKITGPTGIKGRYVDVGNNRLFFSTPRDFARFGLLMLAEGEWAGTQLLEDKNYIDSMTTTSQQLNKSYGYLTWVNEGESYMLPLDRTTYEGRMAPDLPPSSYAGLGANGQIVGVIPDWDVVFIRMGEAEGGSLIVQDLFAEMGTQLKNARIISGIETNTEHIKDIFITDGFAESKHGNQLRVYDLMGRLIASGEQVRLSLGSNIIVSGSETKLINLQP
jgi:CubicO group peptidase (beta-lactamase class C family)